MTHLECVCQGCVGCWLVRRLWVGVAGLVPHDAVSGAWSDDGRQAGGMGDLACVHMRT
jgi:hypothetical protein